LTVGVKQQCRSTTMSYVAQGHRAAIVLSRDHGKN
jgi:hypothetical protein